MLLNGLDSTTELKLILSAGLVLTIVILRTVLTRAIVSKIAPTEHRRRWVVNTRNALLLLIIAGLTAIWAEALRAFAVSLLAIAAAVVIATKDLLQSVLGSLVRAATNAYSIGDRVVIGGHRGDVIDQNLLTTTILEVGPGSAFHLRTGRVITFPNSALLAGPLVNESYSKRYVNHMFPVPVDFNRDWKRAEKVLLEAANAECQNYLELARRSMKELEDAYGLDGLPVQPRINIQVSEPHRLNLLVRVPTPVGRQGKIEQAIIRRFLEEFQDEDAEPPAGNSSVSS